MPKRWTIYALSQELGVDRNSLTRKLKDLEPKDSTLRSDGKTIRYYDLSDVIHHLLRDATPDDPERMSPKDRLDYYKGCRERNLHRKEEGELIEATEVAETWVHLIQVAKGRLLSLPSRLAPDVIRMTELRKIEDRIREEITEVLEELTSDDGDTDTRNSL